ncbi:MAG: CPBP family intramembrane metalloprotease [Clostridia bacterium]|nr:CPBP family intramembrane metalloprotease [Clostridia bacterium]
MEEQLRTETRNMVDIFIGLMLVRVYEYFFYRNHMIPTLSFLSYGVGLLFIFIFNRKHCWSLSDFGIRGSINSTFYEVILPALIWIGSAAAIILPEFIYTKSTGAEKPYFDFVCFNQHVRYILSKSDTTILISWTIIGAIVCVLRALFLETYFRGLCFGVLRKKTNFYACNVVSSLLYAMWFMIVPVRAFIFVSSDRKPMVIGMMAIFFVAQFLFAYRQGYIRLVTNTIWPCVLTTFVYNFFTFNFILNGIGGEKSKDVFDYVRWAVINLIALLFTFLYCKMMKKKFPPPKPTEEEEKLLREMYDDSFGEEYEITPEQNKD